MCSLLKVANRRPINLISPFLVRAEQITFVGSTGDNSSVLVCFSCTVRILFASSVFFMHFPRFATFATRNTTRLQRVVDADHKSCGLFAHLYSRALTKHKPRGHLGFYLPMHSIPPVSGSKSKESTANLFWAFTGSLLLILGKARIVPGGIYTLLGWPYTVVCS